MREGEYLGRVREWYRALARAVERREEEDEKGDEARTRSNACGFGNVEAESGCEKAPSHVGEREEEQVSSAECLKIERSD